ncbi:hypothetical protein RvY_12586 [Ramazzottius varieornatus]|uniref:Glutathione transferase n=1 Tax=Ramazzottius varieornatus TaxID=947166 RepID=A0A1D1VM01_RAMVA|nr:hypothetical protein RvY_12586 [Ramazzottius varieornatus]
MALKVYYDLMSQPSRAVYIFLRCNSIPFSEQPVALRKQEQHQEAFAKINPFRHVPAIDDHGFKLTESSAILKYLSNQYLSPQSQHWYPKNNQQRAKVDEYLDWHHLHTRLNFMMYFQHKILRPVVNKHPVNDDQVEKYRKGIEKTVASIASYFLQDCKFFLGDRISIADLQAVVEIEQVLSSAYDPLVGHSSLQGWRERVREATAPHYQDATKILYQITARIQQLLEKENSDKHVQNN